jgi:hypothetical protein
MSRKQAGLSLTTLSTAKGCGREIEEFVKSSCPDKISIPAGVSKIDSDDLGAYHIVFQ